MHAPSRFLRPSPRTSFGIALFSLLACVLLALQPGGSRADVLPAASDLALARAAFAAADAGEWTRAQAIANGISDPLPAKILLWRNLQRTDTTPDFAAVSAFLDANPDWPYKKVLTLRAESVLDGVSDATAAAWFARHPPLTPMAKLRQAEIRGATDPDGRISAIRAVWVDGNFGADDARQVARRYAGILRPADNIRRLNRLLWDQQWDQATQMLTLVPADWRRLAIARIKLGQMASGAQAAVARVPASRRYDPGLLFERIRWRIRKDNDDDALALAEHVKADPDHAAQWWPYQQILVRYLLQQQQYRRAYRLVTAVELPPGQAQGEAEFLAGWIALRFLDNPALAYPHFERLHDQSGRPLSLARGAYWAGRAAEALGRKTDALTWYTQAAQFPTTYYGQLAAIRPGIPPSPRPVPEPRADATAAAQFDRLELVRAVRLLAAIGDWDDVRPFFQALTAAARSQGDFVLLADLASDIGRPDMGVAVAKQASYQGISLLRAGYPLVPMPRNAGAEQALLLALTRQESAFDTHAVSPTGAQGLLQLEPGTARATARSLGIRYSANRLRTDGIYNVTLGQAYLDGLLANYNGSYILAIAAYNAGPANVQKWIDTFGDPRSPAIDPIDWIEEIPFGETRNYVQRALENLQIYRLRIGNPAFAFSLAYDLRR